MNDARLKRIRDALAARVSERRQREKLRQPCPECGEALTTPDGHLRFRVLGMSESPCRTCRERAEEFAPGRIVFIQMPYARPDLDPAEEERATNLSFLSSCRHDHGMSDEDIQKRYADEYDDLDGLLDALDGAA